MVGCMSAFLVDHDMMIGDVTKNTHTFSRRGSVRNTLRQLEYLGLA